MKAGIAGSRYPPPSIKPASRLNDLLERRPAANHQRRALNLYQLFLAKFREQPAHRLPGRSDNLADLFVRQIEPQLARSVGLRSLGRPRKQQLREFF